MSYVLSGPFDFLQNAASDAQAKLQSASGQIAARVGARKSSGGDGGGETWDKAAGSAQSVLERLRRQSLIEGEGAQYSAYANLVTRFLKGDLAQLKTACDSGDQWGNNNPRAKPMTDSVNGTLRKMAEDVINGKMDPPSGVPSQSVDDLARRLPEVPRYPEPSYSDLGGVCQAGRPMPSVLFSSAYFG